MHAFVIHRDRPTYARRCIDALRRAGLFVTVVDHGSTYPPAIDWLYGRNGSDGPGLGVDVWHDVNRHPRDLWRVNGPIMNTVNPGLPFIVTDCDVVPDEHIPSDWVGWMRVTLDSFPAMRKVGLGLRTDDLPEHYEHRAEVRRWEAQYQPESEGGLRTATYDGRAVLADVDTTLAMYRWFEPFRLGPALRLARPYVARHLTWYEDSANPTPEQAHYRANAQHGHWRAPQGFADDHALEDGS